MAKQYKVDIFKTVLPSLDKKNPDFFNALTEEEAKEIQPLLIMRWLTGGNNARQIYFLNELVNPFVFQLGKHKELLVYLLSLCGTGYSQQRYTFTKVKSKKNTKMPKTVEVIKQIFGYSTTDALESLPLISNDDIISFAEQLGRQKPEITAIKKELRTRNI